MLKKWLCMILVVTLCCASLSMAEDIVVTNEEVTLDELQEELIIDEMPDGIEIETLDDLDLNLVEDGDDQIVLDMGESAEEDLSEDTGSVLEENAPKLTLNYSELLIGIGEKVTFLKATISPANDSDTITWSSDKSSVAKVDKKSGKITGVKKGEATITAKSKSGLNASCKVTVRKAPGKVTASAKTVTISVGETYTLKGTLPSGTGSTLKFTSKDAGIAKVGKYTGVITGVATGSTTITIQTFNGKKATCTVTVVAGPTEVFLPEKLTVALNEKVVVKATAVNETGEETPAQFTFSAKSGTGKISIGAKTGAVRGKAVGTAYLYVKAQNGVCTHYEDEQAVETVCEVTVVEGPDRVELSESEITIGIGQTFDLKPKVLSADGAVIDSASFTVKSSNDSGLKASDKGVITGLKAGEYTVTVTASNGAQATCKVKVVDAPTDVTLTPSKMTLTVGAEGKLEVSFPSGTMGSCTFSSSDTGVATVDESGNVTAVGEGTAVIEVKTHNSKTATCTVTVKAATSGLLVSPATVVAQLKEGGVQLTWRFEEMEESPVTFKSEDTSVARVSDTGYITFVAVGTTRVRVKAENGASVVVTVTVLANETSTVKYRLFAAYSYYDSLPFVKRNANSMAKVFKTSDIDGQSYSTKVLGNPSKASILSGISSFFADTDDDDVSIVYFCSHGHNNKSSYSSYRLSLKGYDSNKNNSKYYLTSKEIFNSIQGIKGRVILILDSCYSGTFINDMKSKLNAEDGRIAVLAAASNTKATFYNVKSKSVDFFTFFLLQGLGYNEKEGWWNKNSSGDKGSYPGYFAADKKGNGDGVATLSEFYSFASNCIDVNIPKYMKKSWYWGDKKIVQKTRFYAGDLKNLVIYQPE